MISIRVKICGITNLGDAQLAVQLGAAMLGFNFYKASPRYIRPAQAAEIIASLPLSAEPVGVFVNAGAAEICEVANVTGIRVVQLHGDEAAMECGEIAQATSLPIIKALRTASDFDSESVAEYAPHCILLDAHGADYGGSGNLADWDIARAVAARVPRIILAGGLTPENIGSAINFVHPYGVDVCSGIESAPGKKDAHRLYAFFDAVKTHERGGVNGRA